MSETKQASQAQPGEHAATGNPTGNAGREP